MFTPNAALTWAKESPPEVGHILGEIQSQLGIDGVEVRLSDSRDYSPL